MYERNQFLCTSTIKKLTHAENTLTSSYLYGYKINTVRDVVWLYGIGYFNEQSFRPYRQVVP